MVFALIAATNPLLILEAPPTTDHLVGWWIVLGLFGVLLAGKLVTRLLARAPERSPARGASA